MTESQGATRGVGVPAVANSIGPAFKMVFLTVLGLTLLSLGFNVVLVLTMTDPNDQAKQLIETCSTITKTGFGAIVGLIGGKAI